VPYAKYAPEIIGILRQRSSEFTTPAMTKVSKQSNSPFRVLISCILSLRTKDSVTAEASNRLYTLAKTPEEMAKLGTRQIAKAIYPVGFYRTKSRRIKGICSRLIKEFRGKVPEDFDTLLTFKGVGRKTANIVMTYGFFRDGYLAIDTHCHRVPNRLGWIKTKTPEQSEEALKKILPRKYWRDFNNIFVQFGQNICKPIGPKCGICPVSRYCKYYKAAAKPLSSLR
jgi:endonuclease-3